MGSSWRRSFRMRSAFSSNRVRSPLTRTPAIMIACWLFIVQDVKPRDIIERFWVKDIVDLVWESRRLRLYKVLLTQIRMRKAGGRLLAQLFEPQTPEALPVLQSERVVSDYQSGDDKGIARVQDALEALGLPEDALSVAAFVQSLPELEKIDQMLRSVESRRNSVRNRASTLRN